MEVASLAALVRGFTEEASRRTALAAGEAGEGPSEGPSEPELGDLVRGFALEAQRLLEEPGLEELCALPAEAGAAVPSERAAPLAGAVRTFAAEAAPLLRALEVESGEADAEPRSSAGVEAAAPQLRALVRGFAFEAGPLLLGAQAPGPADEGVERTATREAQPSERLARKLRGFTEEASQLLAALDGDESGEVSMEELKLGVASGLLEIDAARATGSQRRALAQGFTAEAQRLLEALSAADGAVASGLVGDAEPEAKEGLGDAEARLAALVGDLTMEAERALQECDATAEASAGPGSPEDLQLGQMMRSFTLDAAALLRALDKNQDGRVAVEELKGGARADIVEVCDVEGPGASEEMPSDVAAERSTREADEGAPSSAVSALPVPPVVENGDEAHAVLLRRLVTHGGSLFDLSEVGAERSDETTASDTPGRPDPAAAEIERLRAVVRGFTAEATRILDALDADRDGALALDELRQGIGAGILEACGEEMGGEQPTAPRRPSRESVARFALRGPCALCSPTPRRGRVTEGP